MPSGLLDENRVKDSSSRSLQPLAAESFGEQPVIEVVVMWGESVLHVSHLTAPYAFTVGEAETIEASSGVDYVIGRATLGLERMPVVVDRDGAACVVFGPGATGGITLAEQNVSLAELEQQGLLDVAAELSGGRAYRLPPSAAGFIEYAGLTFLVRPTPQARWVDLRRDPASLRRHTWTLSSTALHLLVLVAFYLLPPHSSALSIDRLATDSRLIDYTLTPTEQLPEEPDWMASQAAGDKSQGGTGQAHDGDSGKLGEVNRKLTNQRFAIKGRADSSNPQLSHEMLKAIAADAGIVGVLRSAAIASAPVSPYGRISAEGNDSLAALGALLGATAGANSGNGGLGMYGTGRGGGGDGKGTIGIGEVATIGHGPGKGPGSGYGSSAGGFHDRGSRVPRVRSEPADVRGSLSKEVIRRTIGRHINEVRYCYEQSLNARPDLQGRVAINFAISASGAVQMAAVSSSDVSDARLEQCIAAAVRRWDFPAPEGGGVVIVTYPFLLSQTGN